MIISAIFGANFDPWSAKPQRHATALGIKEKPHPERVR